MNILETYGPNEKGRDFVIGDMHGSYSAFENLLEKLYFDETKDRMFSVGDLVDRGPESLKCLGLIEEDWFHNVLANHEQMMLEAFEGGYMGNFWLQNGGMWGVSTLAAQELLESMDRGMVDKADVPMTEDDYKLIELLPKVAELPFLITINHKSGKKFHILHAELPPGHIITDDTLSSPGKVEELAKQPAQGGGDFFLWGRYLYMQFYRKDLSNRAKIIRMIGRGHAPGMFNDKLSHIISGHTIMQRPMTILGQTNIDTCAYNSYPEPVQYGEPGHVRAAPKWCGLTCINLDTWEFYNATATEFRKVQPFVVNREDIPTDPAELVEPTEAPMAPPSFFTIPLPDDDN